MILINVVINKMEMTDFDQRTNNAHIICTYDDGVQRQCSKTMQMMETTEELAATLLTDIRNTVKKDNKNRSEEIGDFLIIKFSLDEEELIRRIKSFLDRVADRMKNIRQMRTAEGYLTRLTNSKQLAMNIQ